MALPWVFMTLVAVACYENVHGIAMGKSHDIANGSTIVDYCHETIIGIIRHS